MEPWDGSPKAACLAALVLSGLLGCALEQGTGQPESEPSEPESVPAWPATAELLDSCRRWCGVQAVLNAGECSEGEAVIRGVKLGEPLPATARKSYDLSCVQPCVDWRSPALHCARQAVEMYDCYASQAVFVCDGRQAWDVYGCFGVGEDPSICDAP